MSVDYDSVLGPAIAALGPNTPEARRAIYQRARQTVIDANLPSSETADELSALEAAVARIENAEAQPAEGALLLRPARRGVPTSAQRSVPARGSRVRPGVVGFRRWMVPIVGIVALLIIAAIGYSLWPKAGVTEKTVSAPPARVAEDRTTGASSDVSSYTFKRQLVYYRSIHPEGTMVLARSQGFLYLIRPNVAALRYTVGIGPECANAVGLLLVSAKEDWSEARPSGGSPDRFGARSLALSDTGLRIHGTDVLKRNPKSGCIPLINEDMIDLYDRVGVGARLVIQ